MDRTNERVLVTGASGFLGMHCVAALLNAGYKVRGTVRSDARRAGIVETLEQRGHDVSQLELVLADLQHDDGWDEAAEDCAQVLHVASPLPGSVPKNEEELILPAREGTLRVLRAASTARVRRVVMTSSEVAIRCGHGKTDDRIFDETTWTNLDGKLSAYEKSKTLAEQAAWRFVDSLPEDRAIELVTILPTLILGPMLRRAPSTSSEIVRRMIARQDAGCPDLAWSVVDVRDVAAAHVAALQVQEAAGKRFLCGNTEQSTMVEMAAILQDELGPRGYRIRRRRVPSWLVKLVALFDPGAALAVPMLGDRYRFSNAQLRSVLGVEPRAPREAIVAMAESLIELGAAQPIARP